MNLAGLPPMGLKPEKEGADPKRLAAVARLRCIICMEFCEPQLSETTVHHLIHGRHSRKRAPDSATIPLCDGHHQARFDGSKVAIHRQPAEWKRLYGEDRDWLPVVNDILAGERT